MSNTNESTQVVDKKDDRSIMEFVPFGSQDKIRLSINVIRRLVAVPTSTGKLPTDDDCIKFQMMCKAKRLNPFEGDAFMIGYDTKHGPKFSQITAHQVFLKRAEVNEQFNGMESGAIINREGDLVLEEGDFLLEGDELLGGWCKVYRKDREKPYYKRVNLKTFRKDNQQWRDNPAGMIVKCAEADALRTAFPSLLGSLYIREEMSEASEAPTVSAPIFKAKETKVAIIEAPAVVTDQHQVLVDKLEALAEKDGVAKDVLVEFMLASGFLDQGFSDPVYATDENLNSLIAGWAGFSSAISTVPEFKSKPLTEEVA